MIPQAFQLREPMINKTQTHHLLTLTFKKQNGFPKRKLPGASRFSSLACRSRVGSHPPHVPALKGGGVADMRTALSPPSTPKVKTGELADGRGPALLEL